MSSVLARRPSSETPAIANDGVLPTEVLSEVLLRLPAKVLCRLRLVCRAWRVLTSDPSFAKAHFIRHPLVTGLRKRESDEIHILDLSGHVIRRMQVDETIPSYDLSTQPGIIFISGGLTGAYVLDLAAGAITILPKLAINLITYGPEYVLGYVPSTSEYKVLCRTMCLTGDADRVFHVITLSDGRQWRAMADPPMHISGVSDQRAVVDGVVYFLSTKDRNNTSVADIDIVMFDLMTEEWRPLTLKGPSSSAFSDAEKKVMKTEYMTYIDLVELNGSLVIVNSKHDDYLIDLWFLVDMDKGLWTKRYSVCCSATSWDDCRLQPLTVLADGRIVFFALYGRVLRAYDTKTSTWYWDDLASVDDYSTISMLNGSLLCSEL